jgi:D-glycero-D-manno-heptose 1,7-bisphosphate phosphatase
VGGAAEAAGPAGTAAAAGVAGPEGDGDGSLRPAAFVDRDGTVVVERHYLADPEKVELTRGAGEALRALRAAGYALVLVTNQSGIARGLYAVEDFHAVQARLRELLEAEGVVLDGVYHCPHHPDFTGPCDCRKPAPGLFQRAARELGLDLERSLYIGDRVKDVEPALRFGGTGILVRTGYGADHERAAPPGVEVLDDLGGMPAWLAARGPA